MLGSDIWRLLILKTVLSGEGLDNQKLGTMWSSFFVRRTVDKNAPRGWGPHSDQMADGEPPLSFSRSSQTPKGLVSDGVQESDFPWGSPKGFLGSQEFLTPEGKAVASSPSFSGLAPVPPE